MKKYKLLKNFLYLKVGDIVNITHLCWSEMKKYIISKDKWIIAEIIDSTYFVFEEYFEEIKEEKSIFELQEWDKYYIINCDWNIGLCDYDWWNLDRKFIKTWNIFLTKEEAEKELARRKAIQRIKKYCWENNIEYKENVSNKDFKYEIRYSIINNWLDYTWDINFKYFWYFFFKNIEDTEKVIKNCKEDLKIILDV